MSESTYQQKYDKAQEACAVQVAIVQPWLKQFMEEYNKDHPGAMGTCMYDNGQEDKVRITTSPFGDFYWNTEEGKALMKRQKSNEVGLYYVMGAGAAFVIEYSPAKPALFLYEGQLVQGVHQEPIGAYFLYTEPYTNETKQAAVPMNVALAAQELNSAQNYLGAVYGCMLEAQRRSW